MLSQRNRAQAQVSLRPAAAGAAGVEARGVTETFSLLWVGRDELINGERLFSATGLHPTSLPACVALPKA